MERLSEVSREETRLRSSQGSSDGRSDRSVADSAVVSPLSRIETLARRPNFGTIGFKIPLRVNFIEMRIKDGLCLYRYSVRIEYREKLVKDSDRCRDAFWRAVRNHGNLFGDPSGLVYDDAASLITREPLKLRGRQSIDIELWRPESATFKPSYPDYIVRIRELDELRLSFGETDEESRRSMQFLDSLVTQRVRCPDEVISKDFYPFKESVYLIPRLNASWMNWSKDMGAGMETWTGLYGAVKVKVVLCAVFSVSTKVFYKVDMPLIDFYLSVVNEFRGRALMNRGNLAMDASQRKMLHNALQGKVIVVLGTVFTRRLSSERSSLEAVMRRLNWNKKGMPVDGTCLFNLFRLNIVAVINPINDAQRKLNEFTLKREGEATREMTVTEYFYTYKGIELVYPNLPVIQCGPLSKTIYIPMELLRLSDRVQRGSALDPRERFERIQFILNGINSSEDVFLRAFNAEIGNSFVRFDGRVLPSPHVELFVGDFYIPALGKNGFSIPVKDGVWPLANRVTEAPMKVVFGVICVNQAISIENFRDPFRVLLRACELFGMEFAQEGLLDRVFKEEWNTQDGNVQSLIPIIDAFKKNVRLIEAANVRPMLIFIVPREDSRIYAGIKVACDVKAGIASQVISVKTLIKMKGQAEKNAVAHNVFLKINAKLDGVNNRVLRRCLEWQKFTDPEDPTLFIGIDVTHPSPGDVQSPSIAAVVGSEDVAATRYSCSLKLQERFHERIFYMVDAMRERLLRFYERTKLRPAHIVVFRDGVSNSEFLDTMNEELAHLKTAMNRLASDYDPTISYVVIQKRHHTRFYVEDDQYARGNHNVPPGTVVDDEITSPNMFDFYLCSHLGAIGTSRPAHYTVLYDSWNLLADQWQQMAYALCHLYARCARSVSIPAPVYYAHLACQRARYYIQEAL
ncbi:unnamed protein product [Toxocara canis]|uniref:Piwi domain-containing protein n=1 Tax=Toxocara canis TaxID=6265 RepID=A0A183UF06_TOXCA|nr:unnamed protein product [Toxocara canis]